LPGVHCIDLDEETFNQLAAVAEELVTADFKQGYKECEPCPAVDRRNLVPTVRLPTQVMAHCRTVRREVCSIETGVVEQKMMIFKTAAP
jgi:hypothetical protein